MLRPVSIRRLGSWRRAGVAYNVHAVLDAAGKHVIVINALGPRGEHRFAVVRDDGEAVRAPSAWVVHEDEERTDRAEWFLGYAELEAASRH
jgi:hypothetical protein